MVEAKRAGFLWDASDEVEYLISIYKMTLANSGVTLNDIRDSIGSRVTRHRTKKLVDTLVSKLYVSKIRESGNSAYIYKASCKPLELR